MITLVGVLFLINPEPSSREQQCFELFSVLLGSGLKGAVMRLAVERSGFRISSVRVSTSEFHGVRLRVWDFGT